MRLEPQVRLRPQAVPALLLLAITLAGPAVGAAVAQVPDERGREEEDDPIGRVSGRLLDAGSGEPVAQGFLSLEPLGRRTVSDSTGAFTFLDVPPGSYTLEIRHIAYGTPSAEIEVQGGLTTRVELRLDPEAIALEPLRVEVESRPRFLERVGFYERMEKGIGSFFDPRYIERWSAGYGRGDRFLQHAVLMAAPAFPMVELAPSAATGLAPEFPGGACVYIDGRRDRAPPLYGELSPVEIGAVEVYSGSGGVPDFAADEQGAECVGAIVLWTRRWRREERRGDETALCSPGHEGGRFTVQGTVHDRHTGVALPGARVVANVRAPATGPMRTLTTTADSTGRYRLCDLPAGARLDLRASLLGRDGDPALLDDEGRAVVLRDLIVELAGPGRLVGRILDRETGRPLEGAAVSVGETGRRTLADPQGYFSLDDLPPGDHELAISHVGYAAHAAPVSVSADRTLEVRARLSPDPVALEPIVVTTLRDIRLERRGFYDRREWGERIGAGHFFDREAVQRRAPARISHLLGDLPRVRLRCAGGRGCQVRTITSPTCSHMTVYVDGIRVMAGDGGRSVDYSLDDLVNVAEVAALEVYTGAASIPAEYAGPDAQCGVVAIWTG